MSFHEIEIVEDWKPASAPLNGQNELTLSDLNESENLNSDIDQNHVDIDISIGSVFMLKVKGIIFIKTLIAHFLFPNIIVILYYI